MLERLRGLSSVRVVTYILFFISIIMLAITTFMALNSFDVLKDWKLVAPKNRIEAGQRIVVQSTYTKEREAGGEAVRYLECKNKSGVYLRYELNRRDANRKAGMGGTGVDLIMREDIPDLPTKCKVSISICYDTFIPWYCYQESNESNEFTLYPKSSPSAMAESSEGQKTTQTQVPAEPVSGQSSSQSMASSSQPTPESQTPQSNTSQQPQNETPAPSQPNLIERILSPVTGLLGEG